MQFREITTRSAGGGARTKVSFVNAPLCSVYSAWKIRYSTAKCECHIRSHARQYILLTRFLRKEPSQFPHQLIAEENDIN